MPMPQEETPGLVAAIDEAAVVHHVHHHSSPSSSVITGHRDHHKRKRTKHSVANDALPPHQELTAAWSTIDADRRGATEPATPTGGTHRSQRRAPAAAEGTTDAGGSSSKNDKASSPSSVAPAPTSTSSKAIRVKHSSSSFLIGGGGNKQHPAAGSGSCRSPGGGGSHSYHANNSHAAATPTSSSKRLTIRGPAAPGPHIPAKARRPASTSEAPSAAVPLEVEPGDDGECFRRGVEVFGEWDADTRQAAVDRFVRQQSPPKGGGFSFWLTTEEAEEDLEYVHRKVEEARRTSKAASGSGKPRRH